MTQEEYLRFHETICNEAWACCASQACDDIRHFGRAYWLGQCFDWLVGDVMDHEGPGMQPRTAVKELVVVAGLLAHRSTYDEFKAFGAAGRALSMRKNNDYARPQDHAENPFAVFKNFLKCEELDICSVEAGFLVRLSDKVSRCCNLLGSATGPSVVDEKLEDTLLDIVNYTCLLMAYIETKKIEGAKK